MTIEFQNDGIRYSLVASRQGRRESEVQLEDIKPDYSLWTNLQKRKAGMLRKGHGWRNAHGHGLVLGFLEEPGVRRPDKVRKGQREACIEIKTAPPEHFLESAPAD